MNDIRRIMVVATDIKHSRDAVQVGVSLARKNDAGLPCSILLVKQNHQGG